MNAFDLSPLLRTTVGFDRLNRALGNWAHDVDRKSLEAGNRLSRALGDWAHDVDRKSLEAENQLSRVLGNRAHEAPNYPPYNIEKSGDDSYRVTMAVTGFDEKDIEIALKDSTLTVRASREEAGEERGDGEFLHKGIATRAFERRFRLDDYIKVSGAELSKGLLHVNLVREVPEEKRPQRIAITAS